MTGVKVSLYAMHTSPAKLIRKQNCIIVGVAKVWVLIPQIDKCLTPTGPGNNQSHVWEGRVLAQISGCNFVLPYEGVGQQWMSTLMQGVKRLKAQWLGLCVWMLT